VLQINNPYKATEYLKHVDTQEQADTVLIFAVSEKDMLSGSARFCFDPKKNGDPSYLQPMPKSEKKLKPMTQHAYVTVTPTVNFKVKGADADSASVVRKLYRDGNDADRKQIITDLYGAPDADIKAIFDKQLGVNKPQEGVIYGQEKIFAGDNAVNVMRENKLIKIKENIQQLKNKIHILKESLDYIDERGARKK